MIRRDLTSRVESSTSSSVESLLNHSPSHSRQDSTTTTSFLFANPFAAIHLLVVILFLLTVVTIGIVILAVRCYKRYAKKVGTAEEEHDRKLLGDNSSARSQSQSSSCEIDITDSNEITTADCMKKKDTSASTTGENEFQEQRISNDDGCPAVLIRRNGDQVYCCCFPMTEMVGSAVLYD